jgi:hypothetical protein
LSILSAWSLAAHLSPEPPFQEITFYHRPFHWRKLVRKGWGPMGTLVWDEATEIFQFFQWEYDDEPWWTIGLGSCKSIDKVPNDGNFSMLNNDLQRHMLPIKHPVSTTGHSYFRMKYRSKKAWILSYPLVI